MDVLVCGGGIVGLAAAYNLADRGADVTLCEQGSLGNGSTARAAGGIRSQFSTPVNVELSLASKRVWDTFEERFGVDIGLRKSGYLFLARTAAVAERFRENVRMQRELGADSTLLTPAEAVDRCPGLDPEPFVTATYNPDDGVADPNLAVQGYAGAARERGVEIRTGATVTDVHREGDRVVAADVSQDGRVERREVDFVVNAAGAWASAVGALADVDLPISPRRRQIAVVDPSSPVPERVPLTIDIETGSYFRPERDGAALVGGHFANERRADGDPGRDPDRDPGRDPDGGPRGDPDRNASGDPDVDPNGYDEGMDIEWAANAVERAAAYSDCFGPDTRIKRGWAGLYAVTPDHHPIVEETRPGLVTAAGFSGHGFQHAPAIGRIVADLVLDGDTDLVDLSALAGDRFDRGESLTEHSVA